MGLTQDDSTRDMRPRLTKLLRDLLKPVKVKSLVITKTEGSTLHGVVMTVCPIEKRESGMDFEVGLEGNKGGTIRYVLVDGRRLFHQRPRAIASRRRSSGQSASARQEVRFGRTLSGGRPKV
jgi:hypothetical protein